MKQQRSASASNTCIYEIHLLQHFRNLQHLEDVSSPLENPGVITLEDILFFATGCREIPPIGFEVEPSVDFQHSCGVDDGRYPKANTCACSIQLPVAHNTFSQFKDNMEFGIANGGGFGIP